MLTFQKESFPDDTLNLEWSDLTDIKEMATLQIKGLILDNNRIHEFDTEDLPRGLTHLSVSFNGISMRGLPFRPISNLKTLLISHNEFYNLSVNIGDIFPELETLNIQNNYIEGTHFLQSLRSLKHLNAKKNDIQILQALPPGLETLQVSQCRLSMVQSKLPSTIQCVYLSRNELRFGGLPLNWGTSLRYLDLSWNKIEKFPRKLPDSLQHLNLSHNRIQVLPTSLPSSLKSLHLAHNHITQLPSFLGGNVIDLVFISNNHITHEIKKNSIPWAKVIYDGGNWNESHHHIAQKMIRKCWQAAILRKRIRNFTRSRRVRDELITVAMQPSRAYQIEVLHPNWSIMLSDHIRTDHLMD